MLHLPRSRGGGNGLARRLLTRPFVIVMKRVAIAAGVLTLALLGSLAWRFLASRGEPAAPGGSGIVEGTDWELAPLLAARIEAVLVEPGQRVEAGEVVARLRCEEPEAALAEAGARLAMARAQAESARAQVDAAARGVRAARTVTEATRDELAALQAQRELTEREARRVVLMGEHVAESRRDEVQTEVERLSHQVQATRASTRRGSHQAAAAVAQAEAARAQAQAARENVAAAEAGRRRAAVHVEDCTILAPADAVVEEVYFEAGELAHPGVPLVRLVRLDPVEVTFYLANAELGAATPGREAIVVADAWPQDRFVGHVITVAAEAEFTPRTVQTRDERARLVYPVEVRLPNPDHRLRPGMPVEVSLGGSP